MAINPEDERKRLSEVYSRMTSEELEKLFRVEQTLTDFAKDALRIVMSRRALQIKPEETESPVLEHGTVVTLRSFRDLPEALLAKSILDSAGISSFLADENTIRMDWLWSNLLGGIKLLVRGEDAASATELLSQQTPQNFEVEGVGEYTQPTCPQCHSTDVTWGTQGKRLAYATVFVGVPLPVERSGWKCNSCGNQWDESEQDSSKSE